MITPAQFPKLFEWLDSMLNLEAIARTLPEHAALLDTYARYFRGDAKSKVAEAVRSGKQAHEHD